MTEAMRAIAAIVHQPMGPFELQEILVEAPKAGELRVAVKAVGICHTDLVFASGQTEMTLPAVFGHEGAGIVEAVGPGVTGFAVGDKVLLTFDSCGHCRRCTEGHPAYCQDFTTRNYSPVRPDGTTALSLDGTPLTGQFFGQSSFASHAISRVGNTVKLAPDADLALFAPLGCGVQTGAGAVLRSLGAGPQDVLVVIGGAPRRTIAAWRRDSSAHPSPNAGVVEAGFAGALGVQLGGRTVYPYGVEMRPTLGSGPAPGPADLRAAVALSRRVQRATVLTCAVVAVVRPGVGAAARRLSRRIAG